MAIITFGKMSWWDYCIHILTILLVGVSVGTTIGVLIIIDVADFSDFTLNGLLTVGKQLLSWV